MLKNINEQLVKFSEVDSLHVVWHGNYVRYFEDGREAFGKEFGFGYLDIYKHGFAVPMVDLEIKYKRILEYGDSAIIETRFIDSPAAKVIFEYTITSKNHGYVVCTGRSVQVFLDPKTRELLITNPQFFDEWKEKTKVYS